MRLNPLNFSICTLFLAASAVGAEPANTIEFNRDVRPILSDHCFQCHGPDAAQRKGDLRLDVEPPAGRDGGAVIVAGQPEKSEVWRRVNSSNPDEQMPPPGKGRKLNEAELATLRQWIASGGKFEKHWSLLPIKRPAPPVLASGGRKAPGSADQTENLPHREAHAARSPSNALDAFIRARLQRDGLHPSPPADKPTILRRVTFGLTGLPPSIDEIEIFLVDASPDAYDRVVDRLLASPRYGERMAVPWLDAARYADTSGYQSDGERHMWRWRDWVLDALNANMPFDQFTIEQIAGDLLPNATLDQKIATGFNRNHRGNAEGGIIPEEYAVEYVADRVETTSTVWLGLTLGCCRCHDHKYDPFTQRDFYSLFAFFNNVPEKGRAIKIGNSPPFIPAPTRLQSEELHRLEENKSDARKKINNTHVAEAVAVYDWWNHKSKDRTLGDWYPDDGLIVQLPFDGNLTEYVSRASAEGKINGCQFTRGKVHEAGQFNGDGWIESAKSGNFGFFDKFSLAAWIRIDQAADGGTLISRMVDEPQAEGYQLTIVGGRLQFNLVKRWLDDALRVETTDPLSAGKWHHVAATYDGSRVADGIRLYVDGERQEISILLDELNQSFATNEPLRIGAGGGPAARFRGLIDEVRVYSQALPPEAVTILATPQTLDELFAAPPDELTPGSLAKLGAAYYARFAPESLRSAYREQTLAYRAIKDFEEKLPTVMVMKEMPTPRETHILLRGQYDKPGDRVEPNTPAELPPLVVGTLRVPSSTQHSELRTPHSANRLDLAHWLVSPENPLTSRVIVNRAWQLHFGAGLVKTAEDFGRQGEWPSHPDLLNHLAAEFQSNWDVKRLHRSIVTSATYRQSSGISNLGFMNGDLKKESDASLNPKSPIPNPKLIDPDNRLLSHGPRLRLSAEMVRDQALFASGQFVEQLGGPSVKPLQPAGLWSELTGGGDYQPGTGSELVRRSLYTFWKRTIPPPTLATFDSPSREACTVRESRTNTPLQALALLNEPTFVAASRALASRVIEEAKTPHDRITRAMLHILGRPPTPAELAILTAALNRNLDHHPTDELAAYTLLCTTLLNLDEAITSQ